ncbi:MAG: malonyl-CoA decarboxylase family protein, partial [Pseudomonadota bacterium]
GNDSLFAKLCDAIGRPDLITDPRFTTNGARTGNADALTVELNNALAAKPAADWLSTLDAVGVPSGPINKIDQVLNDVQVRARNMVVTAPDPDLGELLMAGNPIKLSPFTDPATRHPAPALDADRAAILSRVRATDEAPATGGESAAEISPPVARMPAATTSAAVQATAAYLDQVGSFFSRLTDFRAALTSRNDSFEEKAIKLCDALLSERGEVLGTAVAVDLVTLIRAASQAERRQFIDLLADRYAPDQRALATAVDDYRLAPTASNLAALSEAVEAPRQQLFRRANTAPLGTRMLLDLRTEILAGKRDNPGWTPVDDDLRHLFGSWFNRGFLQLRRIDWNTPAAILEKLIDYEAVHTIAGWDDLRRRLASDRRCFAFFHPALPDEPLIFVEIALVNELSDSITPILTAPSPTDKGQGSAPDNGRKIAANTAIFYSISNCQPGLRGIAFGNLLIKQVVSELAAELPGLKTFATLSPIPRLRRHVEQYAQAELREIIGEQLSDEALAATGATSLADALSQLAHECAEAAAAGDPAASDPAHETLAQNILLPLTARYLTGELPGQDGPTDPVGRFHLGNGAAIARVNFAGDVSTKGLAESYGMMVNYQYDLDNIANHHEAFANNQPVARLRAVTDLMGGRDNGLLSGAADLFRSTRS